MLSVFSLESPKAIALPTLVLCQSESGIMENWRSQKGAIDRKNVDCYLKKNKYIALEASPFKRKKTWNFRFVRKSAVVIWIHSQLRPLLKKTWFTCLSTTNRCTIGFLRGRVLMMRLLLSLKWCTPLLRLIIQFFLTITTWFVRSIISGSFESFYDSLTPTMVICWCKETRKRKGYLFLKGEHKSSLQNTRLVAVRSV